MSVPFIDFTKQNQAIQAEVDAGLKRVVEKSSFIMGPDVKKFEEEFAAYCGSKFAIGVNSGTDALYLAVSALDIGPGDEVILPTYTFIATALCVSYTGAKVKFVEIEEETYNIDPKALAKLISKKTKAIIPVHLYGQMANMTSALTITKKPLKSAWPFIMRAPGPLSIFIRGRANLRPSTPISVPMRSKKRF